MLPLAPLLFVFPALACASAFNGYDARGMALGSSGVASARAYEAPLFNPSLIMRARNAWFTRVSMGVRIDDRDDFLDSVERYRENDNEDAFSDALDHFNAEVSQGRLRLDDYTAVLNSTEALLADIEALSDRPLHTGAGVTATVGYAGDTLAAGVFSRQVTDGGSVIRISQTDLDGVRAVLATLRTIETAVRTETVPRDFELADPVEEFLSDVAVEAGYINEYGVVLGWQPQHSHWRIGATVKQIEFETYDYVLPVAEARGTSFRWNEHKRERRFANLDLGVSFEHGPWRFGLAGRNLRKLDVITIRDNIVRMRPQVRFGAAYENARFLVTTDIDLTRNETLGFDPDTRFVSLGGELRFWEYAAFRAGFRHNLVSSESAPSIGLGFGPSQAHADVALINWKGESTFALQAGFQF